MKKAIFILNLLFVSVLVSCDNSAADAPQKTPSNSVKEAEKAPDNSYVVDESKLLKYEVFNERELSTDGESSGSITVIWDVTEIPSKEEIEMTSYRIWEEYGDDWVEYTVWSFLPDSDMKYGAYGIFNIHSVLKIDSKPVMNLTLNKFSFIGSKWEEKSE